MTGLGVPGSLIGLFTAHYVEIYDKISLEFIDVVVFICWIGADQAVDSGKQSEFGEYILV